MSPIGIEIIPTITINRIEEKEEKGEEKGEEKEKEEEKEEEEGEGEEGEKRRK